MSSELDILRIVLIGKTGSGKSSTANTISGIKKFDAALSFDSQTCKMKHVEVERFDKKMTIVDTPGLYDTQDDITNEDTLNEIKKAFIYLAPGPHAIILVIKGNGKYGKEDRDTANTFLKYLGQEMFTHFFVIFCCRDEITRNGGDLDRMVKNSSQQELKKLIACCKGRYFGFDNTSEDENQVKQLIAAIDENVRNNGGNHYSNKLFNDIEKKLEQEGLSPEDFSQPIPALKHEETSNSYSAEEPRESTEGLHETGIKILKFLSAPLWAPFYYAGKQLNMF